jgi:hypothetical protein
MDRAPGLQIPNINVLPIAFVVATLVADRPGIRHTLIGGQVRKPSVVLSSARSR